MRIATTRHANIAAVALANKTVRIAWAMMSRGADYRPLRAWLRVQLGRLGMLHFSQS
jgi:hypothetical protein